MLPADRSRSREEGEAKNLISSVEFRDKGVRAREGVTDYFSLSPTREAAALLPHGRWEDVRQMWNGTDLALIFKAQLDLETWTEDSEIRQPP